MFKKKYLLLSFIVITGAILRFYALDKEGLWYDEVCSINQATHNLFSLFFGFFHDPPLYHFLLKIWMLLFGFSETAIRFLSATIGSLSIFMAYKIARTIFEENIALLSTSLLSLSTFHIFYSQEARYYILSFLLLLVSIYYFLKLINTYLPKYYVYLAIVNTAALLSNPLSIFIVLIEIALLLMQRGVLKRKILMYQSIPLVIFSLWFFSVIYSILRNSDFFKLRTIQLPRPSLEALVDTFKTFNFGGLQYGGCDFKIKSAGAEHFLWTISILFMAFFVYGIFVALSNRYRKKGVYFILLWLFIPLAAFFLFFKRYLPRYSFISLLPYYMLTAVGMAQIKYYKRSLIFLIVILFVHPLFLYYSNPKKINWRDCIRYINDNVKTSDTIIVSTAKELQLFGYYSKHGLLYDRNDALSPTSLLRGSYSMLKGPYSVKKDANYFIGIDNFSQFILKLQEHPEIFSGDSGRSIWLVISRWASDSEAAKVREYLIRYFSAKTEKEFWGVKVYQYTSVDKKLIGMARY